MPKHKCTFGDEITRITIKPDGANELDPCLYEEIETYKNVTVHVLHILE